MAKKEDTNRQEEEILETESAEETEDTSEKNIKNTEESNETNENPCQEYELRWKRALADYENVKRDLVEYKQEVRDRVKEDFAETLLPVMDNFYAAVTHAPEVEDPKVQNWLQGVLYIQKQFEDIFAQLGIEKIDSIGKSFDPHQHDAMQEREEEGHEDGEILEEISQGWKMGDKIIRPARVVINTKK